MTATDSDRPQAPPRPTHAYADPDRHLFDTAKRAHRLTLKPTATAVANIARAHRHRQAQAAALTAAMLCQWADSTTATPTATGKNPPTTPYGPA